MAYRFGGVFATCACTVVNVDAARATTVALARRGGVCTLERTLWKHIETLILQQRCVLGYSG